MKILVIQQKMIGDVLVSSLLCDNLRKEFPKAQIDYLVYENTVSVIQGNPSIDNLVLFQQKHRESKKELLKLALSIRREKYDVIIDAYSKLESWIIVLFSGASKKISYWKKHTNLLYTHPVKKHIVPKTNLGLIIEHRLRLLEPLGISEPSETFPLIYVTKEEKDFAATLFKKNSINPGRKTIMLNITGSETSKTYPFQYMAQVIDQIAKGREVNLLFNYIPKQKQEATALYNLCDAETREKIYFYVLGNSIREFIAIMNNCDMIIGNDGGAINMAKALHKPSFTIFSPWIDKKGWATFEDGINNVSVHLREYKPDLFLDKAPGTIKKDATEFYQEFTPDLFASSLQSFLEIHLKK